jgi:hypothetical protein
MPLTSLRTQNDIHGTGCTSISQQLFTAQKKFLIYTGLGPRRSSGGQSPASHRGGPGSSPGLVIWDLWWTEGHWDRFPPSTSVSTATHLFH